MALVSWIVVGLVLGFAARWVTRRSPGLLMTLLAGVAGAVIGGFIGRLAGYGGVINDFSIWSLLIALGCSIVFLIAVSILLPRRRRR